MSNTSIEKFSVSSGLGDYITKEDMMVPTFKVISTATKYVSQEIVNEHAGSFIHSVSGEIKKEIKAVPLVFKKISSLSEGIYPNTVLKCFSNDFFSPNANPPMSPVCRQIVTGPGGKQLQAVCPYAAWTSVDGKRKPPACKEATVFIMCDMETNLPFQLILRGMNIYGGSPLKKFLSHILTTGKELYCFSTVLSTVAGNTLYPKVTNAQLSRPVIFKDVTYIPDHGQYAEMVSLLKASNLVSDEAEVSSDDAEDSPY